MSDRSKPWFYVYERKFGNFKPLVHETPTNSDVFLFLLIYFIAFESKVSLSKELTYYNNFYKYCAYNTYTKLNF